MLYKKLESKNSGKYFCIHTCCIFHITLCTQTILPQHPTVVHKLRFWAAPSWKDIVLDSLQNCSTLLWKNSNKLENSLCLLCRAFSWAFSFFCPLYFYNSKDTWYTNYMHHQLLLSILMFFIWKTLWILRFRNIICLDRKSRIPVKGFD